MAKVETRPYDSAEFIKTPEDVALFLDEAFLGAREDNDPGLITAALGAVARSQGMAVIAERTGRSRETLYRTLSADGNPTLTTLVDVLEVLGLRLAVAPIEPKAA